MRLLLSTYYRRYTPFLGETVEHRMRECIVLNYERRRINFLT